MKISLLIISFCLSTQIQANNISLQEILIIASKQLGTKSLTVKLTSDECSVIQRENSIGYVIISRSKDSPRRIIGFSETGDWNEDKIPPILVEWIHNLNALNLKPERESISEKETAKSKQTILPLLTCHWHQKSPYNDLSPTISDGNIKTVAGCVAIAAAQIVYYWRKDNPQKTLKDTPTYIYGGAPVTQVIPKGSLNNWEMMLDEYDSSSTPEARGAVAQLCYVLGTTSYLNYASSTGGSIRDAANSMLIQYNLLSEYSTRSHFSQANWEDLLYSNLEKGFPVMCSGQGAGGHAFVLDGYDSELDLYHFNFGWGGDGDGYYPVDNSPSAMGGFFQGQAVVHDIHPKERNIEASLSLREDVCTNKSTDILVNIANNSTLPIHHVNLFLNDNKSEPVIGDIPLWKGPLVPNDGIEIEMVASIPFVNTSKTSYLFLTDENYNVLATLPIEVRDGVTSLQPKSPLPPNSIYDISGLIGRHQNRHRVFVINHDGETIKFAY